MSGALLEVDSAERSLENSSDEGKPRWKAITLRARRVLVAVARNPRFPLSTSDAGGLSLSLPRF